MQTLHVNKVCQVGVNSRNLGFTQTFENDAKRSLAKQKRNMTFLFWADLNFDMVFRGFFVIIFV